MRRSSVVAAALIAISCGAAHASEEWGGSPDGTQAADAEAPTPTTTPPAEASHKRFRAPPLPARKPDLPLDRQTAIYLGFGVATPIGVIGLEGVHRFGQYAEIAGGLGIGSSASGSMTNAPVTHTWQWSLMPRLRLGRNDYNSVTMGAGVSGGQYGGVHICLFDDCDSTYQTAYTLWTNVEIGGEHWTRGGFAIRYFVGYAVGTAVGSQPATNTISPLSFPYTGVGIGYAF